MATIATEAEVKTEIQKWVDLFEDVRAAEASSFVTNYNALRAVLVGTTQGAMSRLSSTVRGRLNALFADSAAALGMCYVEYSRALTKQFEDPAGAYQNVFRDYAENAKRVESRGISFGAASAGASNLGTGTWQRVTKDEWGFALEAVTCEAKLARCTADAASTARKHQEEFSLESPMTGDVLEELGAGTKKTGILALSALNAQELGLLNPSFSSATAGATTSPTSADLPGWTVETTLGGGALTVDGTNFNLVTGTAGTDYYRGFDGDTTPLALKCKVFNWCLSQNLQTNGAAFDKNKPYYFHVVIRPRTGADGTLRLRITNPAGTTGVSVSVNLSDLVVDAWYVLKIGLGTSSQDNWYRNFGSSGLTFAVDRSSGTAGYVDVDDCVIGQFQEFDGSWWIPVGGPVPFEVEDKFTFTDTEYATATIQKWNWRGPKVYLPACATSPTAAPTVALAGAGAGNATNGAHRFTKVWVDVNGVESGESATADVTVVDNTSDGKITVGRNESSPGSHIAYWRIYASKAGVPGTRYRIADVAIGTASYTFNTADGSMSTTTAPTHSVTLADP